MDKLLEKMTAYKDGNLKWDALVDWAVNWDGWGGSDRSLQPGEDPDTHYYDEFGGEHHNSVNDIMFDGRAGRDPLLTMDEVNELTNAVLSAQNGGVEIASGLPDLQESLLAGATEFEYDALFVKLLAVINACRIWRNQCFIVSEPEDAPRGRYVQGTVEADGQLIVQSVSNEATGPGPWNLSEAETTKCAGLGWLPPDDRWWNWYVEFSDDEDDAKIAARLLADTLVEVHAVDTESLEFQSFAYKPDEPECDEDDPGK